MFDLELSYTILLIVCLIAAAGFEFVNGFHDTANAVATVIYTNSMKPWAAVIWSGLMNALGVFLGGISVAMGIVNLLPVETLIDQNIAHSIAMIGALLISAISWNLLTWYFGIPCSSSHTLIGSILGVGIAYSFLPNSAGAAVNWGKAAEIGTSLLISPLFGFSVTIVLMYFLRVLTKGKPYAEDIFKEPKKNSPPPPWIRGTLLLTCTGVSFFHGQNDGQKGVGLIMLILIGIVPGYFALNAGFDTTKLSEPLHRLETVIASIDPNPLSQSDRASLQESKEIDLRLQESIAAKSVDGIPDRTIIKDNLKAIRKVTDYSPGWVILMIALSLGLGTMIGWKRIVKTIGEKIGKEHLTYAQGASAELVAASTIGMSSYFGLPVSTTHVLSSGVAGSMVASKGVKNLQPDTVRNILLAWFLTLPVVMTMAGSLFLLFRSIF